MSAATVSFVCFPSYKKLLRASACVSSPDARSRHNVSMKESLEYGVDSAQEIPTRLIRGSLHISAYGIRHEYGSGMQGVPVYLPALIICLRREQVQLLHGISGISTIFQPSERAEPDPSALKLHLLDLILFFVKSALCLHTLHPP